MTEDAHFKWSSEPLCICLYLGLNPRPLSSSVLPARPQWQILGSKILCNFQKFQIESIISVIKEVMFSVYSVVCLFVCLQLNQHYFSFLYGKRPTKERRDESLEKIRIVL